MKTTLKIFWAHVRANCWCLVHFGHCVQTETWQKADGTEWVRAIYAVSRHGDRYRVEKEFYSDLCLSEPWVN